MCSLWLIAWDELLLFLSYHKIPGRTFSEYDQIHSPVLTSDLDNVKKVMLFFLQYLVFNMQVYDVRNICDFSGFSIVMPSPRNFDIGIYLDYFVDIK